MEVLSFQYNYCQLCGCFIDTRTFSDLFQRDSEYQNRRVVPVKIELFNQLNNWGTAFILLNTENFFPLSFENFLDSNGYIRLSLNDGVISFCGTKPTGNRIRNTQSSKQPLINLTWSWAFPIRTFISSTMLRFKRL